MERIKKVKTAVIGCGAISRIYLQNMKEMFEILELTGCCDLNPRLAEEAAQIYGIRAMSMEEILTDPEIEIAVNLTSPSAHYSVIKTLLEHKKHVYTEKVLATGFDEARDLARLAEARHGLRHGRNHGSGANSLFYQKRGFWPDLYPGIRDLPGRDHPLCKRVYRKRPL